MKHDLVLFAIGRISELAKQYLIGELKSRGMGDLGVSHMEIIGVLTRRRSVQLKELVELIGKDKSTITALTKKLLKKGLIEKRADPDDSRISHISLTEKGRRLEPEVMAISARLRRKAYQHLGEEEREQLAVLLEKIRRNF
jgi:DNA-binding MarR family transcriptional regulator